MMANADMAPAPLAHPIHEMERDQASPGNKNGNVTWVLLFSPCHCEAVIPALSLHPTIPKLPSSFIPAAVENVVDILRPNTLRSRSLDGSDGLNMSQQPANVYIQIQMHQSTASLSEIGKSRAGVHGSLYGKNQRFTLP